MESTTYLVNQLLNNPPATPSGQIISFQPGDDFSWNPKRLCITYSPKHPDGSQLLLHELGHATLGHSDYNKDIELLSLERAAWDQAELLAQQYNLSINENLIEDHLDTYRDWLHSRSLCPQCSFTGLQTGNAQYSCPACHAKWRVNQARTCGLKRYITK